MHGDSPSHFMMSSLSGRWLGQIISAKRHFSHSKESTAMASVWASAARELLHTLVNRFDAQSITVSGNGFPLLISSVLATKINQPP
jgi:hypothetical protein